MTHDPENTLKPLRAVEGDVIALRTGKGGAAAVVRIARAAEGVLRRMLRDDPTASVELRLRALSADDLSAGELLAELRRRDRLPMELAAAFHELTAAANRLATEGGDAAPRDVDVAVAAADGLERHVLSNPYESPLEDPVLTPGGETLIPPAPEDREPVHAVPASRRAAVPWPLVGVGAALLALAVLAFTMMRKDGPDPLREGVAAYSRGDTARAFSFFLDAARKDPKDAEPHYYMAQILRERGRPQEAARELREGLVLAPNDPRLKTEEAYLMLSQGRAPQAAEQFRAAIRLDSTSARAWAGLVTSLRRAGQPALADRVLARAPLEVRSLIGHVRADTGVYAAPAPAPGTMAPPTLPDTTGTVAVPPLQP
ncbi:MAG TPA: tetratricopeptide repeat protein [Longimicrobium sp.]|jgi:tetratricopeptide (TPR) repeat protein|nr:tetratricopeptide repeat protein [Longimicrobium sp.]